MIENETVQRDWRGNVPFHVMERSQTALAPVKFETSRTKTDDEHRIATIAVDRKYIVRSMFLQALLLPDDNETAESLFSRQCSEFDRELTQLEKQVRVFRGYHRDWDEEGAAGIPPDAVNSALRFLNALRQQRPGRAPSGAAPSPDGEIVIYWHSTTNYVEVNFDGSEKLTLGWRSNSTKVSLVEDEEGDASDSGKGHVWAELTRLLEKYFQ